ncbi:hypothetical protein L218DRAFT_872849 [Marasmius fiardii PR-910]|nr:hypothetical protein L218DRAFT_872849 [Marasmius fiardii PR-910]
MPGTQASCLTVFSTTLLIYDIFINLHIEIDHIWMRKWSFLTVIYIAQRYLPLFDTAVLVLYIDLGANLSSSYCTLHYKIAGWSYIVGLMLSELILILRVWTVWGKRIPVGIGLSVFFLACWVPGYVFLAQFLSAMRFVTPPFPFRGCFNTAGSDILYICWVMMMVYEAGTLAMILIPGVQYYRRGGRTELIKTIYRDGTRLIALRLCVPSN